MDMYSLQSMARSEHEQMVRSLPRVPEYGYAMVEPKNSTWNRPVLFARAILATLLSLITK